MPSGVILGTIQMLEVILRLAIVTCRCRFGDFALTDAVVTSIVFVVAVAAEIVCQPHPDDESTFIGNSAPGGSSAGKTALLAAQLIGNLTRLLTWLYCREVELKLERLLSLLQLTPAITDPRITKIRLKWM